MRATSGDVRCLERLLHTKDGKCSCVLLPYLALSPDFKDFQDSQETATPLPSQQIMMTTNAEAAKRVQRAVGGWYDGGWYDGET